MMVVAVSAFVAMIAQSACTFPPETLKNGVMIDSMSQQQVDSFISVCVENLELASNAVDESMENGTKAKELYKGEDLTYLTGRLGYVYRAGKLNGKQYALLPAMSLMNEWLKPGDKVDNLYYNVIRQQHQDGLRDFNDEYKEGLEIIKEGIGMDIEKFVNQ